MNRVVSLVAGLSAWLLTCDLCRADSPLTSTSFHTHYHHNKAVKKAAQTHYLSEELLEELLKVAVPIQDKMALVNGLGWSFDQDLGNSTIYLDRLCELKGIAASDYRKHFDKFTSHELTLLGYMMALENYLNDQMLISIATILEVAVAKDRQCYCADLALTLTKAQILMDDTNHWERVWQVYEKHKMNPDLKNKLKPQAIRVIEEYLALYRNG